MNRETIDAIVLVVELLLAAWVLLAVVRVLFLDHADVGAGEDDEHKAELRRSPFKHLLAYWSREQDAQRAFELELKRIDKNLVPRERRREDDA